MSQVLSVAWGVFVVIGAAIQIWLLMIGAPRPEGQYGEYCRAEPYLGPAISALVIVVGLGGLLHLAGEFGIVRPISWLFDAIALVSLPVLVLWFRAYRKLKRQQSKP